MIRVVLDTNVIVSAHLNEDGLEALVLDLALNRKLQLFLSEPILEEYETVLCRPKFALKPKQITRTLREIRKEGELVRPAMVLSVTRDPADNKFLECADEANADFFITGNKRHFPRTWKRTRIVNARELLTIITPLARS